MFDALIIGMLVLMMGALLRMQKTIGKIQNELSHILESLKRLDKGVE